MGDFHPDETMNIPEFKLFLEIIQFQPVIAYRNQIKNYEPSDQLLNTKNMLKLGVMAKRLTESEPVNPKSGE